jgi:UDP-N-acetylmuramate dehydrogenase
MKLYENYSLKEVATFHVRTNAKYYTEFSSVEELKEIMGSEVVRSKPYMVLGGGSNLLFTGDYQGVIIRNALKGI